jgi:hypothetical protein
VALGGNADNVDEDVFGRLKCVSLILKKGEREEEVI